jgi:hypothetical protein
VVAARVRAVLANGAVELLDDMLNAAIDRDLTAGRLRFGLGLSRVGCPLTALSAVLPDTILVVSLDVALRHGPGSSPLGELETGSAQHGVSVSLRVGVAPVAIRRACDGA